MDIHPPEHPIRSIRDFLLQIFTITCGIVIALGLDSLVSGRREAALLRATRADFVGELTDNLVKIEDVQALAKPNEAWLDRAIEGLTVSLKHGKPKDPGDISHTYPTLRNAAWETAVATQALRLMSFSEARALATAYSHQLTFNDLNARARDQWLSLNAYGGDTDDMPEQDQRSALQMLRVAKGYQLALDGLEGRLAGEYKAAREAIQKAE